MGELRFPGTSVDIKMFKVEESAESAAFHSDESAYKNMWRQRSDGSSLTLGL